MPCRVESDGNRIRIIGILALSDLRRLSAALYSLTVKSGYQDIVLDLSGCIRASPGPVAGLCAQAIALRERGVEIELILPKDRLARLFENSNWAHWIDPTRFGRSRYRGHTNLPLARFTTAEEQSQVVNRFIDAILSSLPELERPDLAAIEWCLNEVTDNVLVHSDTAAGGIVQLSSFRQQRQVEFSVADAGIGIPGSMRFGHPDLDDTRALERAIREGVTRDSALGQGNGLFGTLEVAKGGHGQLYIQSGHARLSYDKDVLRIDSDEIPYSGTLVIARLDCSDPRALGSALKFNSKEYTPLDYIHTHFEDRQSDDVVFRLHEEAASFGSRVAGEPVRTKLANLVRMRDGGRVIVDFAEVSLVSSSFADEVFGKLFVALGPLEFAQSIEVRNMSQTVRALVDKAIFQRMSGAPTPRYMADERRI